LSDAVEELGLEVVLELGVHQLDHRVVGVATLVCDGEARDLTLGDEVRPRLVVMMMTCVLEVDLAPLRVRELTVLEDLKERVEDVGCAFSTSSNSTTLKGLRRLLGELAALLKADVPGGAPNSRATVCFSEYSDM